MNNRIAIVIGGSWKLFGYYNQSYTASTFFYDHNEDEWITGPSLMQARGYHATGIVTDEVTDENYLTVTGGSNINYYGSKDSTEILLDGKWVPGMDHSFCKIT